MCSSAIEQIKTDLELDANKYFIIFKLSLETKIIKVLEISLYYIQKLMSYGFMSGKTHDNCTENPNNRSSRHPRQLIDAIVESVCECI